MPPISLKKAAADCLQDVLIQGLLSSIYSSKAFMKEEELTNKRNLKLHP